ncbi:MAG: transposase [Bacteroidetes bacterium]|nr:transposase [Bacteroidota bacterium]
MAKEGQASIDPVVFFKLILVGYLENLNSDRKIIDHSKMRLDIIYFIGYDIDEELHGTAPFPARGSCMVRKYFCNFLNK